MGIMDFVNRKKGEFKARQERARDNRLMSSIAQRQEYETRLKKERAISENENFVREAKQESRENSFLGRLGANSSARLETRSKKSGPGLKVTLNDNSIFHQKGNNSPYYALSSKEKNQGKSGSKRSGNENSIFTKFSNDSPYYAPNKASSGGFNSGIYTNNRSTINPYGRPAKDNSFNPYASFGYSAPSRAKSKKKGRSITIRL